MPKGWFFVFLWALPLAAQGDHGELRLKVSDPARLGVQSSVELVSDANQFRLSTSTDREGVLVARHLPFGTYLLRVRHDGFVTASQSLEIRSANPLEFRVTLSIAVANESVLVEESETLVDPHATGAVRRIGAETLAGRSASLPGRSVVDLVNSQPGWAYEGNSVLHPRGSEYNTQFVIDGVPLTDNRSPGFAPELEADDIQSLSIFTAGFPAEYGRKLGGVVEVNTLRDARPGFHGKAALSGGSFNTGNASLQTQYGWGKNTLGFGAQGAMTDWYLNPPVQQNYTNSGTTSDFSVHYERDLTDGDRLGLILRRGQSRFEVPNEQIQQAAGQRQDRGNNETIGIVSYQHIFTPNLLLDLRGMVRDVSDTLTANAQSTPILAEQDRGLREGYFKGAVSIHQGRNEWKAGVESDSGSLREKFNYLITDPTQFDPATPGTFAFLGNRLDLEQSAFVQDQIRLGKWTIGAGLRWDHYQLLVNQNAVSPRLSVALYIESADLVLHASYDRIFQTPVFENLLLSSSPSVATLNDKVLRLPVQPSRGNYFEAGLTKGFVKKLKLDASYFRRSVSNYSDDELLLNTAVSFPIAFRKASIYGGEAKVEIPRWGKVSGFASYSYTVGTAFFPVTGGLFLGDDATNALNQLGGRFWDSQDQRNTVRTRVRYEFLPRLWAAAGAEYGSGLPVEFTGTQQDATAQFGQQIVDRVDFARNRVKPSFSMNASLGADLWKKDKRAVRVQVDAQNLNNRLNLLNFAGLFSGNALEPPRSYTFRLETSF